jgi:predicted negative regulator of RcsB-dependent stress response
MVNYQSIVKAIVVFIIVNCQLISVSCLNAQVNYQSQYSTAKSFFKEGKYNLAMEAFKPLIPYGQGNSFSEYASFYYAISAYNQGYGAVAKDMLSQVKTLYPTWDRMDEVNFWLAKIHADRGEASQALQVLSSIKNSKTASEAVALKKSVVALVSDVDLLKSFLKQYPNDEVVGYRLAEVLSNQPSLEGADLELLEKIIAKFKLKKSDFIHEVPPSVKKPVYNVSLLFPFVVNTLDPTPTRKRNQFVLDLYQGMKLAVDTLAKQGIKIKLNAYDTERSQEKIKKLLTYNEIKNTDLIVGPLFQEENTLVQEFSSVNQINLFNPISNNFELVSKNPYGFLFQTSFETLGTHSARFLSSYQPNKKCIVFYGESKRDSILAANFKKEAEMLRIKILHFQRVTKEGSKKIMDILATPTEYDEFKYAKQFSLPKDSLGSVFVASDDPILYTKVFSSVETRGDGVIVVGSENWLDQAGVDYEKYQSLRIILAAPNYTDSNNKWYKAFQRKFIKTYGRSSSYNAYANYAKTGYDFMLFVGHALHKHGVYFQEGLMKESWTPGFLTEGYDYTNSRDNHLVPFIRFEGGKPVVISKQ